MTEELKPCPFCGGKATIRRTEALTDTNTSREHGYGGYFAMCEKCMTSGNNYTTEEICAEHWNRRNNDESKTD